MQSQTFTLHKVVTEYEYKFHEISLLVSHYPQAADTQIYDFLAFCL